jgi:metal-responsive CopG/Arc/MetJ family transcriptional regulator
MADPVAEPRDIEIRFSVTRTMAQRIDALVQAKGLQGRSDLLTPVIQTLLEKEIHEAIVLLRCAGINPTDEQWGRDRAA